MAVSHQLKFCQHIDEFFSIFLERFFKSSSVITSAAFPISVVYFYFHTTVYLHFAIFSGVNVDGFTNPLSRLLVSTSSRAWSVSSLKSGKTAQTSPVPTTISALLWSRTGFFETLVTRIKMRDEVVCLLLHRLATVGSSSYGFNTFQSSSDLLWMS